MWKLEKIDLALWVAWVVVYFCRVVLITNGIIYAISGISYNNQTYSGFALRENGNSSTIPHTFPVMVPVIKDAVTEDQFDGVLILAPFSKYTTCAGLIRKSYVFFYYC